MSYPTGQPPTPAPQPYPANYRPPPPTPPQPGPYCAWYYVGPDHAGNPVWEGPAAEGGCTGCAPGPPAPTTLPPPGTWLLTACAK